MLKIFRKSPPPAPAAVPKGTRVYAIGDIHGRLDLLEQLVGQIEADQAARGASEIQLIFLGDVIDRGPDSRGVIDLLMDLGRRYPNTRFLKGNHEELLLLALEDNREAVRLFSRVGGRATAVSYGIAGELFDAVDCGELHQLLVRHVPPEHVAFIEGFEDLVQLGGYAFVHAGVRPGSALSEQKPSDLRWIRREFLHSTDDHGAVVVHGHSPSEEVQQRPNRIGIDTGAFSTGRLTALGLEGSERWILQTAAA